jgi:hypothetical protein
MKNNSIGGKDKNKKYKRRNLKYQKVLEIVDFTDFYH